MVYFEWIILLCVFLYYDNKFQIYLNDGMLWKDICFINFLNKILKLNCIILSYKNMEHHPIQETDVYVTIADFFAERLNGCVGCYS